VTVRVLPVVDQELLTPCPGDDREVVTVKDLALRDIANRSAVDCANGRLNAVKETLDAAQAAL